MPELTHAVVTIAEEAAAQILEVYETDFEVQSKADQSPLTRADIASHNLICDSLAELTPEIPVLSEESAQLPYSTRKTWEQYWLIDPLDGTREFIKRNGEFTVNIALVRDNFPILGVIYVPVSHVCYYASKDQGAWKREAGAAAVRIRTKTSASDSLVIAGSRSHGNKKQQAFTSKMGAQAKKIATGSSLKFCLVAEGSADIYARFGPTSEWDSAAGQCIVEEAGGRVTNTGFARLRYNAGESLINPDFLVVADPAFGWQQWL